MKSILAVLFVLSSASASFANRCDPMAKPAKALKSVSIVDTKSKRDFHSWNDELNEVVRQALGLHLKFDVTDKGGKIYQLDQRADFAQLADRLTTVARKLSSQKGKAFSVEMPSDTEIFIQAPKVSGGFLWPAELDTAINYSMDVQRVGMYYNPTDSGISLRLQYIPGALEKIAQKLTEVTRGTRWKIIKK